MANTPVREAATGPGETATILRLVLLVIVIFAAVSLVYLWLDFNPRRTGLGNLDRLEAVRIVYEELAPLDYEQPVVISLGDSLGMSAFDANCFEELSGGTIRAYNLGLTGKSLPEFLFDAGEPGLSNAYVVLFISTSHTFNPTNNKIHPRKANLYRLYRFPYDHDSWLAYGQCTQPGLVTDVMKPRWQHVLDSRWRVNEWFTADLKTMMGRSANTTGYDNVCDVKYPVFRGTAPRERVEARLDDIYDTAPFLFEDPVTLPDIQGAALTNIVESLGEQSKGLYLVLCPAHPGLRERIGPERLAAYKDLIFQLQSDDVTVIDLTECLDASGFRDHAHIANDAARVATTEIYRKMELNKQD